MARDAARQYGFGWAVYLCAVLGTPSFAGLAVKPQSPQQPLVFRAGIHGVQVDVSVRDGNVPVIGLTSDDFLLTDNGIEQTVQAVAIAAIPVDVTLLVDTSGSTLAVIEQFKAAVQQWVGLLRPADRVRLVTIADRVDEVFPMQSPGGSLPLGAIHAGGSTAINDGVIYAFAWDPGFDRRHLIVAFTDGLDNQSVSQPTMVVAVASRQDAVMHVVLSSGPLPSAAVLSGAERAELASRSSIVDAAVRSGGAVHQVADAVGAFHDVFEDFRESYTLYYSPHGVAPAGWHDLHVSVRRPNGARLTVRARKGYAGE